MGVSLSVSLCSLDVAYQFFFGPVEMTFGLVHGKL